MFLALQLGFSRHSLTRMDISCVQWALGPPWGLLPVGRAGKTSRGSRPRGILIRCLNWPLLIQRSCSSTLSFSPVVRTCYPSSQAEPTLLGLLYLWSHSLGFYPELMTKGEGWDIDWLLNQKLCLQAQLPLHHDSAVQYNIHITAAAAAPNLMMYRNFAL